MSRKRFSYPSIIAALAALPFLLGAGSALAAPAEHLNWGQNLAASDTSCPSGQSLIDVNLKVTNDADSGFGGYWALDDYVKHISVVQTGTDSYCATVAYEGTFTTVSGASPNNTGTIAAGVVGSFQGGYTWDFTGTFSPTAQTKGSLGTYNYGCTIINNQESGCNPLSWTSLFFSSTSTYNPTWWGWVYHAGSNGSWINQINGSSGDITGD